jgi:membrane protein DedA with SNARE-associated domain
MVASGFLVHSGFFNVFYAYIILVIGDLVGDIIWYGVGYYIAGPILNKHGHFLNITPELFDNLKELFRKYQVKILLISKITIGFGGMALVTLITAGATKISFKKYMTINIIGEFILVAVLLSIGYFFGEIYLSIPRNFKIIFILSILTLIVLMVRRSSRYMKNKIKNI